MAYTLVLALMVADDDIPPDDLADSLAVPLRDLVLTHYGATDADLTRGVVCLVPYPHAPWPRDIAGAGPRLRNDLP